MYIVPFSKMQSVAQLRSEQVVPEQQQVGEAQLPFKDIFRQAIDDIKTTDAIEKMDSINLAMGNTDDLHNIIINMDKAAMAVEFATEVRNKVLDAYNEVMRMNV